MLMVFGLALASSQKYYVKRFIKDHKFLYLPIKKLVDLKHQLLNAGSDNQETARSEVLAAPKVGPWQLRIDASQPGVRYERFWGNLGYESLKNGTLASESRQLFALLRESNLRNPNTFRYVRAHNLFGDGVSPWGEGCDIYNENAAGEAVYNWEIVDQVFDEILRSGLKPMVEFGFMPDELASIPERRQKWSKANISPPKDYNRWRDLVYATVSHLLQRYGAAEIRSWRFEVWNEPDLGYLFWIEDPEHKPWGDLEEYFKLYDYTVDGAKAAFPEIQIGGPVSAGLAIGEFLEHSYLRKNYVTGQTGTAVDFISSHAYGKIYPPIRAKKGKNIVDGIQLKIGRAIEHDHPRVRDAMRALPFLLTETGPSTNNAPYYNTRFVAAWWAKLIDAGFYIGEKRGPAYQPDEVVLWASEQVVKSFSTGWGIATRLKTDQGWKVFKRPAYNIFEMCAHLSEERLPKINGAEFADPIHAIATRGPAQSLEILVYHLDEWDYDNASADSQAVTLIIENLPFADYTLSWYAIDESHSNSFAVWTNLGKPEVLDRNQAELMDRRDDLELYEPIAEITSTQRKFERSFKLQSNSVALFVLTKQTKTAMN